MDTGRDGRQPGSDLATLEPRKPKKQALPYTNEDLHRDMMEEAEKMGIAAILQPGTIEPLTSQMSSDPVMRREQLKDYLRQIAAMREMMGASQPPAVPVKKRSTQLLATPADSSAEKKPAGWKLRTGKTWSGNYGGSLEETTRTVGDEPAWRQLWSKISAEAVPEVDFSSHQIVSVFLGQRESGGYAVEIREVAMDAVHITVRYSETTPPPGRPPPEGTTSPYIFRLIQKSDLPVRYIKE